MQEHFVVVRLVGDKGRKQWDFVVQDDELILHRYALQNLMPDGWEDVVFWQRGVGCTMDRINVPMPLDVTKDAMCLGAPLDENVPLQEAPVPVYTGVHYDSVADVHSENQTLADALNRHIRAHTYATSSGF